MTTKRQVSPYGILCQYKFADGRQCTMSASDSSSYGYCLSHDKLIRQPPPTESDLSPFVERFYSFTNEDLDVHRALEQVFLSLAANRVSYQRASSLAYLGQLILFSEPTKELAKLPQSDIQEIYDTCELLLHPTNSPKTKRPDPPPAPAESPELVPVTPSSNGHNHHHPK